MARPTAAPARERPGAARRARQQPQRAQQQEQVQRLGPQPPGTGQHRGLSRYSAAADRPPPPAVQAPPQRAQETGRGQQQQILRQLGHDQVRPEQTEQRTEEPVLQGAATATASPAAAPAWPHRVPAAGTAPRRRPGPWAPATSTAPEQGLFGQVQGSGQPEGAAQAALRFRRRRRSGRREAHWAGSAGRRLAGARNTGVNLLRAPLLEISRRSTSSPYRGSMLSSRNSYLCVSSVVPAPRMGLAVMRVKGPASTSPR